MTHADLCGRAARWLAGTMRCGVVLTEITTSAREVPDAIGWRQSGESILVECKASRADFLGDKRKGHRVLRGAGRERWYFVPKGLIRPGELPEGWGLAEVADSGRVMRTVRATASEPDEREELRIMYSALRRTLHGLGAEVVARKALLGADE